jgi:histidinol dehydrogenase
MRSLVAAPASVEEDVRKIIDSVRARGDRAVLEHTRRLDTAGNEPRSLTVSARELDEAIKRLSLDVVAGLQVAIANVAEVAAAAVSDERTIALPQGHRIRLREMPVGSAAVYVPGGRAPYPSTVVMGVVAARAAGVLDVAVCTPPGADGEIHSAILGTCRLCGVQRVYRMGGAQAVAALALGTETVSRVDVVVGPGSMYVQQAKRLLNSDVGIDSFAGPSDLLLILGEDTAPDAVKWAALDMLAQGEHGEGSIIAALTTGTAVADTLAQELQQRLSEQPASAGATLLLVEADDPLRALEIANAFAPEHLQLIGRGAEALAAQVISAGCVFVGPHSATAFGDYVAGSNHVLPTAGAARFASMLSPRHFRRTVAEVMIEPRSASTLARAGAPIARAEGFEWHARSMEARVGDNRES